MHQKILLMKTYKLFHQEKKKEKKKLMLKKIPKKYPQGPFLQLNEIISLNSPVVALFNLILREIIMFFF